jgi:hypothetical protein
LTPKLTPKLADHLVGRGALTLTTWNVSGRMRTKWGALEALAPTIAVLQEVAQTDMAARLRARWFGNLKSKGLGVVPFGDAEVRIHAAWEPRIEFVVPLEVLAPVPFLLLATWVMHRRALNVYPDRPQRMQMLQALDLYEPLLRSQPSVVTGDFSNGVYWDRPRKADNHAHTVARMAELGLVSACHWRSRCEQGREAEPTFYWRRHQDAPFHIDYLWIPDGCTNAVLDVQVGPYAAWVGGRLSDHVPLTVSLDPQLLGQPTAT